MVARIAQAFSAADLRVQLGVALPLPLLPRFNVSPAHPLFVLRRTTSSTSPEPWPMRWGLIPGWAKSPERALASIRLEEASDNAACRTPLRRRRCVVPASGWFVWRETDGRRIPLYAGSTDGTLLLMAAVWENWQGGDGSDVDTVALLTRPADGPPAPRDERDPVLLRPGEIDRWLDPFQQSADLALTLVRNSDWPPLKRHPVHPRLANPAQDDPALIRPHPA